METILWALGIAATLVFGVSANERMEQGLPVIPKLSGFKPNGLLPEGDHIEEVYQPQGVDQFVHPAHAVQTVSDPHVDSYVQEWVAAHEGTGDQVDGYAPESPELWANQPTNSTRIVNENSGFSEPELNDRESESTIFNSLKSESPGEFTLYEDLVAEGLAPKGNEILYRIWKVKPGDSEAYRQARVRRNEFAERLG